MQNVQRRLFFMYENSKSLIALWLEARRVNEPVKLGNRMRSKLRDEIHTHTQAALEVDEGQRDCNFNRPRTATSILIRA